MSLVVKDLTKKYKNNSAVESLSFHIDEKKCIALLGPNGAGKTTTLQMLAGLLTPTSGEIWFMGKKAINRKEIGYLPQYPAFYPWMTAKEYLYFSGRLSQLNKKDCKEKITEILQFVQLYEAKNQRIEGFSGGMKQRLGIAQALLHEPKLLILDEPVSALDPSGRLDILHMLHELKQKISILFSTHVLHDAQQICDEVMIMKDGKIKWAGTEKKLSNWKEEEGCCILTTVEPLEPLLNKCDYIQNKKMLSANSAEIVLINGVPTNKLLQDCIHACLTILEMKQKQPSLEEIYMEVITT